MKKRVRLVSGFFSLLAVLLLAPRVNASLPRTSTERAPKAIALTVASEPAEPSVFSLFTGDESAHATNESSEGFHPFAAISLLTEDSNRDLAPALEPRYPKTRVWAFEVLGSTLVSRSSALSLETHWACGDFSCGLSSGGRKDPMGLQSVGEDPIDPDYADAARPYLEARARESQATRTVGRIAGGIATGLDIATDLGPGIGWVKFGANIFDAALHGDRRTVMIAVGTVAGGAAVAILARRLARLNRVGAKAVNEIDQATLSAERRAAAELNAQAEAKGLAQVDRIIEESERSAGVRRASAYPQERRVAGRREGRRTTDPLRGFQEEGAFEWTPENVSRMERGQPPIGRDGREIELHHRNQDSAGPLDELTAATHGDVDHPESPSRIDRNQFKGERRRYWVERVREFHGQD